MVVNNIHLAKEFHITPDVVDKMPYFLYETYLEQVNIIIKKQNEENEAQQQKYDSMKSDFNPSKMMNSYKTTMPQISAPKLPSIK